MILGGNCSIASVGWIAAIALIMTWIQSGWSQALFWFGIILLMGAVLFACILVFTIVCELLNVRTKRSRRDAIVYFGWAFVFKSEKSSGWTKTQSRSTVNAFLAHRSVVRGGSYSLSFERTVSGHLKRLIGG